MNTNQYEQEAHEMIDHIFQEILPNYGMAERPAQIKLSHEMLEAMLGGKIALCDAGTGIGKTYAYLVAGPVSRHKALSTDPDLDLQYCPAKRSTGRVSAKALPCFAACRTYRCPAASRCPKRKKSLCLR